MSTITPADPHRPSPLSPGHFPPSAYLEAVQGLVRLEGERKLRSILHILAATLYHLAAEGDSFEVVVSLKELTQRFPSSWRGLYRLLGKEGENIASSGASLFIEEFRAVRGAGNAVAYTIRLRTPEECARLVREALAPQAGPQGPGGGFGEKFSPDKNAVQDDDSANEFLEDLSEDPRVGQRAYSPELALEGVVAGVLPSGMLALDVPLMDSEERVLVAVPPTAAFGDAVREARSQALRQRRFRPSDDELRKIALRSRKALRGLALPEARVLPTVKKQNSLTYDPIVQDILSVVGKSDAKSVRAWRAVARFLGEDRVRRALAEARDLLASPRGGLRNPAGWLIWKLQQISREQQVHVPLRGFYHAPQPQPGFAQAAPAA